MGRKKHPGYCYLCGKYSNNRTREHVPPECFAPRPLEPFVQTSTSKFQYAWACASCNGYYGKKEKTFKNFMLMGAEENIQAADDAWAEFVNENRKSLSAHGIPSKEFREILTTFPNREIYSPQGIYWGIHRAGKISSDQWLFLKEECIKIAKGLHSIHTDTIIPQNYEAFVLMNEKVVYPSKNLGQPTFYRHDTNFFEYYGYVSMEDLTKGLWFMRFYKGYIVQVGFRPQR